MTNTTNETIDVRYIKGIARRRIKSFILVFLLLFIVGAVVALALPSKYKSEATILIENQLIPAEYVQSTITGFVEQRIQIITQQVMSSTKLQEIIDRFNLYEDLRERYTSSEIIEKMREDVILNMISAEVRDTQTGRATEATIAFNVGYEGKNPGIVQRVANVLASLYMELNLKNREQRATTTTTFLQRELDELGVRIEELQGAISDFKQAHIGELPENIIVTLQSINRLNQQLESNALRIGQLKERRILLEGQLANVDPMRPLVNEEGEVVMNPQDQLKAMRLQLLSLKSQFSGKHPDVIRLTKEIKKLEAETGPTDDRTELAQRLEELTTEMARIKGEKGAGHPDVVKLSKEIESLEEALERSKTRLATLAVFEEKPDNPAYINISTQIAATNSEIQSALEEARAIRQKLDEYQGLLANAPTVEKEYSTLLRDLESARQKYAEMTSKLMEARVAQGMEESQSGERFIIIDPPQLPEKPHKPNRIAIALISFVLAFGAGIGLAAVREAVDTSVKSAQELSTLTGVPVLSEIMRMESPQEKRRKWTRRFFYLVILCAIIAVGIFLFNQYVMPLEVFWAKVQRYLLKLQLM